MSTMDMSSTRKSRRVTFAPGTRSPEPRIDWKKIKAICKALDELPRPTSTRKIAMDQDLKLYIRSTGPLNCQLSEEGDMKIYTVSGNIDRVLEFQVDEAMDVDLNDPAHSVVKIEFDGQVTNCFEGTIENLGIRVPIRVRGRVRRVYKVHHLVPPPSPRPLSRDSGRISSNSEGSLGCDQHLPEQSDAPAAAGDDASGSASSFSSSATEKAKEIATVARTGISSYSENGNFKVNFQFMTYEIKLIVRRNLDGSFSDLFGSDNVKEVVNSLSMSSRKGGGTYKYFRKHWSSNNPRYKVCRYTYLQAPFFDLCPDDNKVEIRTLAVKQNGVVMQGWLHFEVELTDKSDEIMAIYVQKRDEYFNAIRGFVTKEDEQCPADPKLAQPTKYQILPCSAIGFREAKISNVVFMSRKDLLIYPNLGEMYLAEKDISRGIHSTWRLSEYWCNRHLRFRPEAIIFTKKMWNTNVLIPPPGPAHIRPYRKAASYWLFPGYFGSADIKLEATTLTCDQEVIDYRQGSKGRLLTNPDGSLVAAWLQNKSELSTLDNDYVSTKQQYFDNSTETINTLPPYNNGTKRAGIWSLKSCQANTRQQNQPTFSGRCTHHFEKTPHHDALQGCNLDVNASEFQDDALKDIQTYQDYVLHLTVNRSQQCATPCRIPMNLSDLMEIQVFNTTFRPTRKPTVIMFTNIGATRNGSRSKVEKFWAGRKFHGEMLVFWSMFLIPVGTFASRYLKETAMGYPCIGIHLWFWIHLATTLFGLGMLGCGLLALYDILNIFGRSLNEFSYHHRRTTITSILLFILMGLIGGLRPINYKMRLVTMCIHSVMGFLIYFLNLISIILSTWIPASPSMPNKCDEEGHPEGYSGIAIVTAIWMVLDLLFHIGMTLLQLWMDRQNGVKRDGFFCPIVPFLPENSASDMKGKGIRGIVFIVYASLSFIFSMTVVGMLAGTEINPMCKNLTGPSSCEEVWGCSNWAMAYAEVYPRNPTPSPQAAN